MSELRKQSPDEHPMTGALLDLGRGFSEFRVETGALSPGWTTAEAFFGDDAAIEDFLAFERSHHPDMDARTCAALMMLDYCYVLMLATVPLLIGHSIVPDLSPENVALQVFDDSHDHDGATHRTRRAHVRFLSTRFGSADASHATHPDVIPVLDRRELSEVFRRETEAHCAPLVEALFRKTRLSRSALWRLVADAVTGRCLEVGRLFRCLEDAKAIGMAIVKQPGSPLANRQLQYLDLTLHDDEGAPLGSWTFRLRGGCCRYYTVAGGKLCSTCVLKDPEVRDAELLEAMRRHADRLTGKA